MTDRTYLDWNATAPLRPEAKAAMAAALDRLGNPSSVHAEGRLARHLVEEARANVAALVGALPRQVTFTSGGTEANMAALTPGSGARGIERLIVSAVEHSSVLSGGRFPAEAVETIPVDEHGTVDVAALRRQLEAKPGRALVSVMLANNETGVIQPIQAVAAIVREAEGWLHVDAVQGPGKMACAIDDLRADVMTISAHKIGGPQGVGAMVRGSDALQIDPLIRGGGQERGIRAGTENVLGIIGFGAAATAASAALDEERRHMLGLRNRLESGLKAVSPHATIFGAAAERLPNTTLVSVAERKAETLVIAFDLAGIAVSSGAACSSGRVAASHVLAAMGVPDDLARGAVRVSLGRSTTDEDIDRFLNTWKKLSSGLSQEAKGIAA